MIRAPVLPLIMAIAFGTCTAAHAAANVTPIPGDTFAAAPIPAEANPHSSCAVAKAYVEHIQAGRYDRVGEVYAADAVFVAPNGQVINGRAAIGEFYARFLPTVKPQIVPLSFIADGRECVMELAQRNPDGKTFQLVAIDHFTANTQGLAERMVVFLRPQVMAALSMSPSKP